MTIVFQCGKDIIFKSTAGQWSVVIMEVATTCLHHMVANKLISKKYQQMFLTRDDLRFIFSSNQNSVESMKIEGVLSLLEENKNKFSVDESIKIIEMIEQLPIKIEIKNDIKFIFENSIQTQSDIELF
uniref:Uncharacterized protein n=1 Tax=viral metagenome TaxID=1070528 RepID=A0A6C0HXX0_9ZZZZ